MVGQQFVSRLARHPWFRCTWLAASERSEGKPYTAVAPWRLAAPMPDGCRATASSKPACPGKGPKVVFSALDASVAGDIEARLRRGRPHRGQQRPQLPHGSARAAADSRGQRRSPRAARRAAARARAGPGAIVTNPNCSTIVLAMALAPLRQFGITRGDRHDDAGGVGRGLSRRAVARHPRQRRAVHRRRRREDGERDAEDSRQRRRPHAATPRSSARTPTACR